MNTSVPTAALRHRSKTHRWRLVVLTATAVVAMGCGAEGEPEDQQSKLTPHQYRQLQHLYYVQVEAEKQSDREALRMVLRACRDIDVSDPLLAAAVTGCEEAASLPLLARNASCQDATSCTIQLRRTARQIDDVLRSVKRGQRSVRRILGDANCAEALVAPPRLNQAFAELAHALRDMATAIETGDQALAQDASETFTETQKSLENFPSATQLRRTFRQRCSI